MSQSAQYRGIDRRNFSRLPAQDTEEANRELALRAERLATAMREFEELSLAVANDFRVPMAAIEQAARALGLGERGLDRETAVAVRAIGDNIAEMRAMTFNLLKLCRLSGQSLELDLVDMEVLAREAWVSLPGTERFQFSVARLPAARCHRGMLTLVWSILLSQAMGHCARRDRPCVEVTGGCGGEHAVYGIRDNGTALDLGISGKLTYVLERIQEQSSQPGIGVGLAIVQRVVTRHRGTVWAEARHDEGALFQFSLPVEPAGHRERSL